MDQPQASGEPVVYDIDGNALPRPSERDRLLRRYRLLRGALAVALMAVATACVAPLFAAVVIALQGLGESSVDIARLVSWSHEETIVPMTDFVLFAAAFAILEAACVVAAVFMLHNRVHPRGWLGVLVAGLVGLALTVVVWLQGMDALEGYFALLASLFAFVVAVSIFEVWRASWFRDASKAL